MKIRKDLGWLLDELLGVSLEVRVHTRCVLEERFPGTKVLGVVEDGGYE
jgi:hypothetical protein